MKVFHVSRAGTCFCLTPYSQHVQLALWKASSTQIPSSLLKLFDLPCMSLKGKRFEAPLIGQCICKVMKRHVETIISCPPNRTVPSPANSPGWSPGQHHRARWGGRPLCLQGLQRRPTSYTMAETHHSERQSLRA